MLITAPSKSATTPLRVRSSLSGFLCLRCNLYKLVCRLFVRRRKLICRPLVCRQAFYAKDGGWQTVGSVDCPLAAISWSVYRRQQFPFLSCPVLSSFCFECLATGRGFFARQAGQSIPKRKKSPDPKGSRQSFVQADQN